MAHRRELEPAANLTLQAPSGNFASASWRDLTSIPQRQFLHLSDAFETQDVAFISDAIGVFARAKGMKQIAQDAGVSRESLYRPLSTTGNPELGTVLKVLASMNIKISAKLVLKSAMMD